METIGLNTNSNYGWGWDPSQDELDRYLFRSVLNALAPILRTTL
jgi:hypothetical protein